MTVSDLIQALAQFAPGAMVVFWDGDHETYMTPANIHKHEDGDVELEGIYAAAERESQP